MNVLQAYQSDPCGTLSIPYWKYKYITTPDNIKIIHEREFSKEWLFSYHDEPYFRLYHALENIAETILDTYVLETAALSDMPCFVEIINESYTDISVTYDQLMEYRSTEVYHPSLWVKAIHRQTGRMVGCGIADVDRELREGIIEWVQVLPAYRGSKIGQMIVNGLLQRMKTLAAFATVSGQVNNPASPENLYRKCGFTGHDVWHVLKRI